ncbi:MAG: DUF4399 domain-containing protein [Mariprofundus sp.]
MAMFAIGLISCSEPKPEAHVSFVQPKDGATVGRTFKVVMAVEGMEVRKAGDIVPGTGHFHLIVDQGEDSYIPLQAVIIKDRSHLHFGKGQTETTLHMFPGKHTLTLQFGNGHHKSYGRELSQTINITVK